MFARRCFQWIVLYSLAVLTVYSQTIDTEHSSNATFKAQARLVVVDVVVTDHKGEPVTGLQKSDFQVSDEGQQQIIASFEEHRGVPDQGTMPPLPANVYTNYPVRQAPDSLDVILLDSLNTPLSDQSKVHVQLASFLKSVPSGAHIALFSLSSGVQMVQGFTSDTSILLAALNKKPQSRTRQSPLLAVGTASNLDADINTQLTTSGAGMPADAVASMEKLQQFQNQTQNSQDQMRATLTLQALEALANYLRGIPGRKNLIWFSRSFPLSIIPGRGVQNYESSLSEQLQLRRTVNLLVAAQVAIYPISPEGLTQTFISNESRVKSVDKNSWRTVQGQQVSEVTSPTWDTDQGLQGQELRDHARQIAHESSMYEIATDTGGEAFYNTNGFNDALGRAISDGAHYYTIAYSPTNKKTDGNFRPIEIKLSKGDYRLAYRRGYFAEEAGGANAAVQESHDSLRPLMMSGLPDSTQIVFKVRVSPLPPSQHTPNPTNTNSKTSLKGPLTRYGIDFAVLLPDLTFKVTPDGQHNAKVEIALVAYDQAGTPVNSIVKSDDISLNPQLYATFGKLGLQLHEEIDVPNVGVYLRTGICDLLTNKTGTLQVPLSPAGQSHGAK